MPKQHVSKLVNKRPATPRLRVPGLAVGYQGTALVNAAGQVSTMSHEESVSWIESEIVPIVCHHPEALRRLNIKRFIALDLLELFAFVRPATFCRPTISGIAEILDLKTPGSLTDEARLLQSAAGTLLTELLDIKSDQEFRSIGNIARAMNTASWSWGNLVLEALDIDDQQNSGPLSYEALEVWRQLPEWSEQAPVRTSDIKPVAPEEARRRLASLVGPKSEDRPQQGDYASAVSQAFTGQNIDEHPITVLAEAGTGVGKTLGYIAPVSIWAEENNGAVWISTFTRNLQRQIDAELTHLYPDPVEKNQKVVVRKGRENYLCLLNFEDAITGLIEEPEGTIGLGLMARWASKSRDGDVGGGDFPPWIATLTSMRNTLDLTDSRGECVYSACAHYHRCFIEKSVRRARRADIVIANHALVLAQNTTSGTDDRQLPTHLIFDEGHHLYDAVDDAFAVVLSADETSEIRRWIIGPEEGTRTRSRGLRRRIDEFIPFNSKLAELTNELIEAAYILPAPGWRQRIFEGTRRSIGDEFFDKIRAHVYARAKDPHTAYDIEVETNDLPPELLEAAERLGGALNNILQPIRALSAQLILTLEEHAKDLDTSTRNRIENIVGSLQRRTERILDPWKSMLETLSEDASTDFVTWFSVNRRRGRDIDVGMHRRWIDPMLPFANTILGSMHGTVITSATLRDSSGNHEKDWQTAERRTGTHHLPHPPLRAQVPSPFDYSTQTRVLLVTDIAKDDLTQVSGAFRELFLAAGGDGLGLFTAISRLRQVHKIIAPAMDAAGYTLLAQHVDTMDTGSLVDIFRTEQKSCLLGTDAVRDGVDVPGQCLRLIVFDRVPWPRPSILHRARRKSFSGSNYDDMITRLRLKQAFGRLIRQKADTGVFVMLDPMMPTRLIGAFPQGVNVIRTGIADAILATRTFLS